MMRIGVRSSFHGCYLSGAGPLKRGLMLKNRCNTAASVREVRQNRDQRWENA